MDEVIRLFNRKGVRYLLIGGQAMRLHGMPRFSMDWDFFVPPKDAENMARINDALGKELDVPLVILGESGGNAVQTYQTRWGVLQFHLGVPGLPSFVECEKRAKVIATENGVEARCLCGEDILKSKMSANRAQDQVDVEFLRKKKESGLL